LSKRVGRPRRNFAENVQLEVCVPAAATQQFEAWIDEFAEETKVRWEKKRQVMKK
jgi:hypothetical protein